jgi:hypothetical protein
MINAKLQNIIDTKSAIGNAIVNKGGTITGETPFFNYAAQIDGISTGTPQTIFAASDGSKWALTNAVNLTNVSNNVTSDFNYWQPANNGTSDPILNIGTVNGNISGNIRIVQVNQVNIAQYVNLVATDTIGGKYVGYNGFDQITNPTPTGNTTFNRWLLNNSASGTVIFANATFTTGIYNGPNASQNITNMAFINNTVAYSGQIRSVATNNNFIYFGGGGDRVIQKHHEGNLISVGSTANFGGDIRTIATNNGFIYAGGVNIEVIRRYSESNLAFLANSASYGGTIFSIKTNNGFIYAAGAGNRTIQKFHESNLAFISASAGYGGDIQTMTINNGFIYVGGSTNQTVQKFHEGNLAFVGNTNNYGGTILSVTTNNGFIYAGGGFGNQRVQKFHESNLAFVGSTADYGQTIYSVNTSNGFIYVGGVAQVVRKYYESNLALVANTPDYGGWIFATALNNGFIYAGGGVGNQTLKKFQQEQFTPDNKTFYTATKIKE